MFKKISLIIILLLIAGCGGFKKDTPSLEPEVIEYHKGTDGLVMEFLQNSPPDEIWKGSEFAIGIELKNKGTYPIESGSIILSGFVPEYINIAPLEKTIDLQAKGPGYPEGDYTVINFKARNFGLAKASKEYTDSIIARAYYDYQTDATADVCINPRLYSYVKTKETICEVKEITLSGGQGAPVAVKSIKELISQSGDGLEVEFRIDIENVGPGEVLGEVELESVKLSKRSLNCLPRLLDIKKKEKTIYCKTKIGKDQGAYIAPLSISLSYTYTSQINKKIKIITLNTKK